ncbi:MAG: glycosyl hydrolase [Lacipirellulaceae bacterium]
MIAMVLATSIFSSPAESFAEEPSVLVVNTAASEPVNNALLGYNIFHFESQRERDFIERINPVAMRFPDGVWGNFYNWETDGFTNHGDEHHRSHVYAPVLAKWKELGIKGGIAGLTKLNDQKLQRDGAGYNIVWLYNAAFDSPEKNVARMQDSIEKGFVVRDIELGNEQFWLTQVSNRTLTPEGYRDAARGISKALKQANPDVRVSVTLSWRDQHDSWNKIVADDDQYFDAISLHKYSGSGKDESEDDAKLKTVLAGRKHLAESAAYVRSFAQKPIWLTEWGLNSGKDAKAASALSMADCYLYLFENQDTFHRANWFSVNGVARSFVAMGKNRRPVEPLRKTAFGCVHEIMRGIFEDADLLSTTVETSTLDTGAGTVDVVTARAVKKDGRLIICAINLSDQPSQLAITIDRNNETAVLTHEALAFNSMGETLLLDIDANPLESIELTNNRVTLSPRSINKIVMAGQDGDAYK